MKTKLSLILSCILCIMMLTSCGSEQQNTEQTVNTSASSKCVSLQSRTAETFPNQTSAAQNTKNTADGKENAAMKMNVQIGNSTFTASPENNAAADALVKMMESAPLTIKMNDYGGFEKVGYLGTSLPVSDCHTTTQAGDIVLYQGNQIVIFYGSNSWSYTRLGKIDDLNGWEKALGSGDVTVTFSLQ